MRRAGRLIARFVVVFTLVVAVGWAALVAAMHVERRTLIYRFDLWRTDARATGGPGRLVEMEAADGTPLLLWAHAPAPGQPTVLHFGGNAGVLRMAVARVRPLVEAGYGVVVMNYRGAGGMAGAPSEAAITADALEVYDRIAEVPGFGAGAPVLYGASLGAAVAVQVAAERPAAAVILAAPFARLCETAQHHYPWLPACLVLRDETWDTLGTIGRVSAPLLVLHGARDRVIPLSQAARLVEAAPEPKRFVTYPRAGHRDLAAHGAVGEILAFLASLRSGI